MAENKLILSACLTGAMTPKEICPNLPITPEEIAADAVACIKAGASIIHIHVRDKDARFTMETEYFVQAVDAVKASCDSLGEVHALCIDLIPYSFINGTGKCVNIFRMCLEPGTCLLTALLVKGLYIHKFCPVKHLFSLSHKFLDILDSLPPGTVAHILLGQLSPEFRDCAEAMTVHPVFQHAVHRGNDAKILYGGGADLDSAGACKQHLDHSLAAVDSCSGSQIKADLRAHEGNPSQALCILIST